MGVKYKRDHPDGSGEIFESVIERPSEQQRYFDDMILNNDSTEGLSLEFYRFGKEQSYPLRTVRHRKESRFILHYVLDGKGYFRGEPIVKGQGFVIFPNEECTMAADNEDPWHFCWIIFGGRDAYALLKSVGIDRGRYVFDFSFLKKAEEIFDELIYFEHNDADMGLYMCSKFYELLAYQKKQYSDVLQSYASKKSYVVRAMNYIEKNYSSPIRVEDIAGELHISRKYLCRIFAEYRGISTKEYIISKRLDVASSLLLDSELSISEIAREVGYADYTQLTRLFKVKKGMSPQEYRNKYSGGRKNV